MKTTLLDVSESLKGKGVILFEPLEDDKGLIISSGCGFLLPVSNRNVTTDFSELDKARSFDWFLIDPPSPEVLGACALLHYLDGDRTLGGTLNHALKIVADRCESVGCLARHVLCREKDYVKRINQVKRVSAEQLLSDLPNLSLYDVPPHAKFLVAPYLIPDNEECRVDTSNDQGYSFRFLSNSLAITTSNLAFSFPDSVKALVKFGLTFQIQEAILNAALLGDSSLTAPFQTANWEWFEDPGSDQLTTVLPSNSISCLGHPNHISRFSGRYLERRVTDLKEDALYLSTGWQTVVGECLTVSHMNKLVTLYQTSGKLPQNHPFKITQLKKWRQCLALDENGYRLVVVYVIDSNISPKLVRGMRVSLDDRSQVPLCDLDKAHYSCYVVRALTLPDSEQVVFSIPPPAVQLPPDTLVWYASKGQRYHSKSTCSKSATLSVMFGAVAPTLTPCLNCW